MLGMVNLGIGGMLVQRVAHAYGQQDLQRAGAYFLNGMYVYLIITAVFTVFGFILAYLLPLIFKTLSGNQELLINCFQMAVVAAALGILNECLRGFAQAMLRPLFSIVAMAVFRIVGIGITVLMLYQHQGLLAIPAGMLVAELLIFIGGALQAASLLRGLRVKIRKDHAIVREYFRIGGNMFMARIGSVVSRESDPLLITFFTRPEITTAYMVTRKAADIVFQMLSIIYGSTHSAFSHLAGQGDEVKTGKIATKFISLVFIVGLIGFVLFVGMNHSFISLWVGETFALDQPIILFIGLGFFISSVRNVVLQTLNGLGDFEVTSRVILIEGVSRVGLSVLLFAFLGISGVPISLIVTGIVSTAVLSIKLKADVQLQFTAQAFFKACFLMVLLFGLGEGAGHIYSVTSSWLHFALATCALALVACTVSVMVYWRLFRQNLQGYPIWRH